MIKYVLSILLICVAYAQPSLSSEFIDGETFIQVWEDNSLQIHITGEAAKFMWDKLEVQAKPFHEMNVSYKETKDMRCNVHHNQNSPDTYECTLHQIYNIKTGNIKSKKEPQSSFYK